MNTSFYDAVLAYKGDPNKYRELQAHIDRDLMPGLLGLLHENTYQPVLVNCTSIGFFIASLVANELQWKSGSIDRLSNILIEDKRQDLYIMIYKAIQAWDVDQIEFELFFPPVLTELIVEWYKEQ
jgi:hypothetical protein